MKMLDYVQLAHVRMGENLERSSELVAQLGVGMMNWTPS